MTRIKLLDDMMLAHTTTTSNVAKSVTTLCEDMESSIADLHTQADLATETSQSAMDLAKNAQLTTELALSQIPDTAALTCKLEDALCIFDKMRCLLPKETMTPGASACATNAVDDHTHHEDVRPPNSNIPAELARAEDTILTSLSTLGQDLEDSLNTAIQAHASTPCTTLTPLALESAAHQHHANNIGQLPEDQHTLSSTMILTFIILQVTAHNPTHFITPSINFKQYW